MKKNDKIHNLIKRLISEMHRYNMRTAALAVLVAIVTVYMIILPADTLTKDTAAELGGVGVDTVEAEADEGSSEETGAAEGIAVGDASEEADPEESAADADEEDAYAGDSEDADLQDAEDAAEAEELQDEEAEEGVSFEKQVLASDGRDYRITVTCGPEACIPEGAELAVVEILPEEESRHQEEVPEEDLSYEEYVAGTEDALGWKEGTSSYARVFDISIVADGDKVQPADGQTVDVRIELADSSDEELSVVHFEDGSDEGTVVENTTTEEAEEGKTVVFDAEGFSVYSVVSREEPATDPAAANSLNGKSYAMVTLNSALLQGRPFSSDAGKLDSVSANPTVGGTVQVTGNITMWHFEAVPGQSGWYYISDGHENYINITSGSGNGGTVTLGEKQPVYVAERKANGQSVYQLRNSEEQRNSKAVNNYGNNTGNGFGAWTSSTDANNDWFRLYDMEFLGDVKVSFNANGGTGVAPEDIWGIPGNTITLPDYTGTRSGYTFIGWSTHKNVADRDYHPLYLAGSQYILPDNNTTLYAIWTNNTPTKGEFYIRLDGTIPYEPQQYENSDYTGKIEITGTVKYQSWLTDNDPTKPNNGLYVKNDVTAKLNQVPDVNQLVDIINRSSNKLGFKVRNKDGELVVDEITNLSVNAGKYNVSAGNALYVLWYVQKFAGGNWHIDGSLLVKNKVNIAYDGNTPDGSAKNVPLGYQETPGTEVTIGASGRKDGPQLTPTRPGYIFLGWNTKPDGSGTPYNNNDKYTLNEDTTLYAQWSKGTNYMTVCKTNSEGETLQGARFKLEEKTAGGYTEKYSASTGESGTFIYDRMENDTLYRMTETYAPNGYEVQNAFFFKVDANTEGELQLHVCDENGDHINVPEWLKIEYISAEDPAAQGVARIRFNIKDERIKRNIKFIKVDENGDPLAGAEYTLKNSKGNTVTDVLKETADSEGVFTVNNAELAYGSYTLEETKAPVMFAANEPVKFTLNDYVSDEKNGLTITEDRSGSVRENRCDVTTETIQGLKVTTYSYTVKFRDVKQPHIIVTKDVEVDGDLEKSDLDTTIYFALTKKGEEGYVTKPDGSIWIETMKIRNGEPEPARVIFDGVDYGEYDVWEMALIDGEYTRMYNGMEVADNFQLDTVAAKSDDGGNNANVSENDSEAQVDFTNHYGKITAHTSFTANKRWADRAGNTINPPEGAKIEFTLWSEKKDASGNVIEGTQEKVRSIELDGAHDPDGEDTPWQAVFKYLPIYYEGNLEYAYKVEETVTADGYYPNYYPERYYVTSSGGTITNRKLSTDVKIHKQFELFPDNAGLLEGIGDKLTFTLTGPGGKVGEYKLSDFARIADAQDGIYDYVLTLHDMPFGRYSVTESGQSDLLKDKGYDLAYTVSSTEGEANVDVGADQPVLELDLQNSYAEKGSLVVRKNSIIHEAVDVDVVPKEISGKVFRFVVKRGNLYLQENGTLGIMPYEFGLQEGESRRFENVPAGMYTVIEQDASVEDYRWEVVGGTRNADGTYSLPVLISGETGAGEAAFDNRYTKIEYADLKVSKKVTGGPEGAAEKYYNVEITTTLHGDKVWLDADGNLSAEEQVLTVAQEKPLNFENIPAGTYTVTENKADAAYTDYELDVKYSLDDSYHGATPVVDASDDGTESGTTGEDTAAGTSEGYTFTIHKDGEADVTIANNYNYLYTPVKLTKTVTGNMGDKELNFGFDVYLTDAEGNPIVIEGRTGSNGKLIGSINLKHGQDTTIDKLPKGARIRIVEHNVHYDTHVDGWVGIDETKTEALDAETSHKEEGTETTCTYAFTIPDKGATVDFYNDYTVEQTVELKKVGYNNIDESQVPLAGATFKIYSDEEKKNPARIGDKEELTSDADGLLYSGKIGAGTYYLDETVVPDGYLTPEGMLVLTVDENGVTLGRTVVSGQPDLNDWITRNDETAGGADSDKEETVYTVTIRNTTGAVLPSTGGMGTTVIYTAGALLLTISGILRAVLKVLAMKA